MQTARLVRFGPFELDVRAGELRKHGVRIRLAEQSFQILLMLLDHPGEVVLRSEIQSKLWPENTLVEFDQSINAAIKRLRNALGESADEPIYIETLKRRGYRFLGAVEFDGESQLEPGRHLVSPVDFAGSFENRGGAAVAVAHAASKPPVAELERPAFQPRKRRYLWLVAVALSAGLGWAIFSWGERQPRLTPSNPVPLTTFPGLSTFSSFSPDGTKIAFSWVGPPRKDSRHPLNIYVKPVGNGDPVAVTTDIADDRLPQWSPDGSMIAFQRSALPGHELYIVPSGGGTPRKIADMGIGLAWSPDGKEIAYVSPYPPAGSGGIVVRSLETGRVRELTNPKPYAEGLVAWSPDGRQIAFSRSLTPSAQELFVVPSKGGTARRLTFDKQNTEGFAWTPDSTELVFVSYRLGGPNLWRIPAKGGTPERVMSMAHHPSYPTVALHGNRLAFTEAFGDSNIWQYTRPGSATASFASPQCLICSTVEDDSPRFSPDGRKIVFVSKRTGTGEIWVADSDGSYPIQLTNIGGAGSPRWSPDSRWIVFDSRVLGSPDLFVVSAQGGATRQLTSEPTAEIKPSWSHDGRWVYFGSDRGGLYQVWKVPFTGGAAQRVTQGHGAEVLESPDGKRLYYFRDDVIGMWTVPVDGGPEEVIPELRTLRVTRAWTVREEGIYFFQDGPAGEYLIQLFNFATRRVTTVLAPQAGPLRTSPGLDLSPDGRRFLYTQTDQKVEGLMMIENFR